MPILIDSHVHIHNCYNLEEFFRNTFINFSEYANKIEKGKEWIGVVCLTEIEGVDYFNLLKDSKSKLDLSNYKIQTTSEENSIIVSNKREQKIIVIAGKQIIANDGIEILALGTANNFSEGRSIKDTVDEINNVNAIAVLPWGVGKWLGKRKEIIKNFIEVNKTPKFFLGDNSGRPSFWSESEIFKLGRSLNHFVLPGTDALAISSEVNKTGTYGLYLNSELNLNEPTKDLFQQILNLKTQPQAFGKLETPVKFFKNQITMQINKRRK
ncbi:MAG: hypothetical protein KDC90_10155 [Ignavibacteriae bacterium]|nr:hypothetical protein [Ignavibacteriota bacterium]